MTDVDVLIVGGGPTGLTLACELARRGVTFRVIDRSPEFHHQSRGKGIQPRSLEVFDDLGVVQDFLDAGTSEMPARIYMDRRFVAELHLLAGVRPDHAEQQRLARLREFALDAREQAHVVRLGTEQLGVAAQHDADGVRQRPRQRPGARARVPAELVGEREHPLARLVTDPGLPVEGVGDRGLGQPEPFGQSRDRDPSRSRHHVSLRVRAATTLQSPPRPGARPSGLTWLHE